MTELSSFPKIFFGTPSKFINSKYLGMLKKTLHKQDKKCFLNGISILCVGKVHEKVIRVFPIWNSVDYLLAGIIKPTEGILGTAIN